jgi:serine/threonine-protein kinase HipA
VSHLLPYDAPRINEADSEKFRENRKRISISGAQEKLSLVQEKNKLRLTREGEQGTHILKPMPRDLKKMDQVPANEHLTMLIASQVYSISTAPCALIFFQNGDPAFITRRFDLREDGAKWSKEDFATLAEKTTDTDGPNYKYRLSYEEVGQLIIRYVPASKVEMNKYFLLVLFNYLFSNGDAHLKNFSLLENESGDYFLSPAYDLINTRIHVSDQDFALERGLFADDFRSESFRKYGFPGKLDFLELARRIGIQRIRAEKIMEPFLVYQEKVEDLVSRSFLDAASKKDYLWDYRTRCYRLNA